ncbi:MAG: hypothetical protein A2Y53_07495 [Chloroflexi bacterium RBG_16_47_49]|nr:MAG: hypothetical protein A2Y53_07495 [Chloroflexi bacterium RBG_16_47_49]
MSHPIRLSLVIVVLLAGLLLAWGVVQAAPALQVSPGTSGISMLATPTPLPDQPAVVSPDISFIDSPTASCILPRANTGVCFMTWYYMYANADPNYIITMTVGIDDKARARYNGFFQTNMFVPSELMVFRVACGELGSGGNPNLGAIHNYVLRARDSAGLGAANYGTVFCPADEPARIFLPLLNR